MIQNSIINDSANIAVFCATCRSAQQQGLITYSEHQKPAFVSDGFHKWKNALRKFREHENSSMHKEAALKLAAKSSSVGLHAQLSSVILANHNNFIEKCC